MWSGLWGRRRCHQAKVNQTRVQGRLHWAGRKLFLEPLEQRQLLAAIVVNGTSGADTITIDKSISGTELAVTLNGGAPAVYTGPIDSVTVNGGDGADVINLDGVPTSSGGSATITEAEPNDSTAAAQDLESAGWVSSTADPNVDDGEGHPIVEPHVTVNAVFDGSADYYSFAVTSNSLVRVDIDGVSSLAAFDSLVRIVDASDTTVTDLNNVPAENDGIFPEDTGSAPGTSDAFLVANLAPGTYYIRVAEYPSTSFFSGTTYQMHVSASGHSVSGGGGTPTVTIDGGADADTLNVAAPLMPSSAIPYILKVGNQPFAGELSHDGSPIVGYTSVESFNGGAAYTVQTDLAFLGKQDGSADNTFIRPNPGSTELLIDVNGVTYFAGGINTILIAEVIGSTDEDTVLVQNTVIGAHVSGGEGSDTITTSFGPDIILGGGGNDLISTDGGNDYVAGGEGEDTVNGGAGDDSLSGNGGNDSLSGGGGHDVVSGGAGDDHVAGQQGQDVLIGGTGADQVIGNSDRDLLFAAGVVVIETGGPVSLGDSDSSQFGDDNYFRLNDLREDWLDVVALALVFQDFNNKYDSTASDGVEDRLQGGSGDDVFFTDGSNHIIDSVDDREATT